MVGQMPSDGILLTWECLSLVSLASFPCEFPIIRRDLRSVVANVFHNHMAPTIAVSRVETLDTEDTHARSILSLWRSLKNCSIFELSKLILPVSLQRFALIFFCDRSSQRIPLLKHSKSSTRLDLIACNYLRHIGACTDLFSVIITHCYSWSQYAGPVCWVTLLLFLFKNWIFKIEFQDPHYNYSALQCD